MLFRSLAHARVNSIHHQGIKHLAPGFEVEAWSYPDRVPEAIRRKPGQGGRGYIAATQWHPEFHREGNWVNTVDDSAILHDFLDGCLGARMRVQPPPHATQGKIRDRAARLLRQALLRH